MMGSGFIITDILGCKRKLTRTYSRLILALSLFDSVSSAMFFLSTWPIPSEKDVFGASGTALTCKLQGFLLTLGQGSWMYNVSLTAYYYMFIFLEWNERRIKKVEIGLHIVSLLMALGFASLCLVLNVYHPMGSFCWINRVKDDNGLIIAGKYAVLMRVVFFGFIWIAFASVVFMQTKIVYGVRQRELSVQQSLPTSDIPLTRTVFLQSILYLLAFFLVWLVPTIQAIVFLFTKSKTISALSGFFAPLQGFINFIIYIRPRLLEYRRANENASCFYIFYKAIAKTICCCNQNSDQ